MTLGGAVTEPARAHLAEDHMAGGVRDTHGTIPARRMVRARAPPTGSPRLAAYRFGAERPLSPLRRS